MSDNQIQALYMGYKTEAYEMYDLIPDDLEPEDYDLTAEDQE